MSESRAQYKFDLADIEGVISFLYANIDFFAASYLGFFPFNHDSPPCRRTPLATPLSKDFQTWTQTLVGKDANNLKKLRYELWQAVQHDEDTWRMMLVGAPTLEDKISLFYMRKPDGLEKFLFDNPRVVNILQRYTLNPVIKKWYAEQANPEMRGRRACREKYYTHLAATSSEDLYEYKRSLYKLLYCNIEYFAQINNPDIAPDELLADIIQHLTSNPPLDKKKYAASDSSDDEDKQQITINLKDAFVQSLIGDNKIDSCRGLISEDQTRMEVLFMLTPKLMRLIQRYKVPCNKMLITKWYEKHATLEQKQAALQRKYLAARNEKRERLNEEGSLVRSLNSELQRITDASNNLYEACKESKNTISEKTTNKARELLKMIYNQFPFNLEEYKTLIDEFKEKLAEFKPEEIKKQQKKSDEIKSSPAIFTLTQPANQKDRETAEIEWRERLAKVKIGHGGLYKSPSAMSCLMHYKSQLEKLVTEVHEKYKTYINERKRTI